MSLREINQVVINLVRAGGGEPFYFPLLSCAALGPVIRPLHSKASMGQVSVLAMFHH